MSRPSWDAYFMGLAIAASKRSTCDRAFVGAIIVKDKDVISTGYNGSPPGLPHCDDVGHFMVEDHCSRTIHAETNAILRAARNGVSIKGATIYTTHSPCLNCAKMIIGAGIVKVVSKQIYRDSTALNLISEANITNVVIYED